MNTECTLQLTHKSITEGGSLMNLTHFNTTSAHIIDCLISHVVTGGSQENQNKRIEQTYQHLKTTGKRFLE